MRNCLSKCGAFSVQVCDGSSYKKVKETLENLFNFLIWFIFNAGLWLVIHFIHWFHKISPQLPCWTKNCLFKAFWLRLIICFVLIFISQKMHIFFLIKAGRVKNEFDQEINQSRYTLAFEIWDPVESMEGEFYIFVTKNQEFAQWKRE